MHCYYFACWLDMKKCYLYILVLKQIKLLLYCIKMNPQRDWNFICYPAANKWSGCFASKINSHYTRKERAKYKTLIKYLRLVRRRTNFPKDCKPQRRFVASIYLWSKTNNVGGCGFHIPWKNVFKYPCYLSYCKCADINLELKHV